MEIKRRNCIKSDEIQEEMLKAGVTLEVFQNYSRPACIIECRAREIYEKCGCLPYYFPNFASVWKKDTTCTVDGLECLASNAGISYFSTPLHLSHFFSFVGLLSALETGANDQAHDEEGFAKGADCYCPVDCEENLYMPEMSQADIRPDAKALSVMICISGRHFAQTICNFPNFSDFPGPGSGHT